MQPTNNTILVTGGTGFIGSYVVDELGRRGLSCRVLAREVRRGSLDPGGPVDLVIGDILDQKCVRESMRGVSYVIHLAAAVTGWAANPSLFNDVNIIGTRNVLQAAVQEGVGSFVHVSSGSAIDFIGDGIRDERAIVSRVRNTTEYGKSKALAEQEVDRKAKEGLHTTIVYPTRVFGIGPLDDSNAATRVIDAYLRGRLPVLPGNGMSFANWGYVNDIAVGIVQALFRGSPGGRYILGGENSRLRDIFAMARSIAGRYPVCIPVPLSVGRAVASLEEVRARLFRSRPRITRAWYDGVFEDTRLSCARASAEIGYGITPLRRAMEEVVRWLTEGK
jgi:nucleoside-diphosphate-sugar epimerase